MHKPITIRIAAKKDAESILSIYAPYVKNTAVTFEYDVPSCTEFANRMRRIQSRYPYLVAEAGGEIAGYAYASPFQERAAYEWAVETTIYIKSNQRRQGIGSQLYQALERALHMQGVLNLNACIAYPEVEDETLTKDSVTFHQKMNYRLVGTFHQCGYKFDRWYHMVWMEKHLGDHRKHPGRVVPFEKVRFHFSEIYGIL